MFGPAGLKQVKETVKFTAKEINLMLSNYLLYEVKFKRERSWINLNRDVLTALTLFNLYMKSIKKKVFP